MLSITSPLTSLPGVGPVLAKRLGRLDLHTIGDLLNHFPSRYEDFSHFARIAELKVGERVTVRGKVQLITSRRAFRRRLHITEALVGDGSGTVKAVWFNLPYLAQTIKPGQEVLLAGTLQSTHYGLQLEHPTVEPVERGGHRLGGAGVHTGRLVPIYPATALLTQRQLRALVAHVLPLARTLRDWLPPEIRTPTKLPSLSQAVSALHWPGSREQLTGARKRVTFDELLIIHLKSLLGRQALSLIQAPIVPFSPDTKQLVASLPWKLTEDQRLATWEIIKDLGQTRPMFRLLQGDVGSGKTVVAGLAGFNCARAGWQTALLAPTEILAEQHFRTLVNLLEPWGIRLALLTHGHHQLSGELADPSATMVKRQIREGKVDLVMGTHALLQSSVTFAKLGLVVVDEQHRWGVAHRQSLLAERTPAPHLLSLTATPIPRSLALTLYGDLDISVLKSLPPGRLPIVTRLVPPSERARAYQLMRHEITKGNRVFIICPLIEESDVLGVRAATAEHERLGREVFPNLRLGLLHGKLGTREKTRVMNDFKTGRTPVLVATSVVEVGMDVPEATVMAIEGAERFGVAQLHQFRGRVGRSDKPSYCLLFTDGATTKGLERLKAMANLQSGFDLAEYDLKQRGPGDLLGETQSGFLKLRFAELANAELLKTVRQAGERLMKLDDSLSRWPELRARISQETFHPE